MGSRLGLGRIVVEGFRGVNRPVHLSCSPRCTLLVAPNGKGKTSVLGAIEWCLFGELKFQERENPSHDELVNLHHPSGRATVELTLTRAGEGEVIVRRSRVLGRGASELTVFAPDGSTYHGAEATGFLFRLAGLTFQDFYRTVFLHQESVRGLLVDTQGSRDEALDRLLGLDRPRSMLAAVPLHAVQAAIREVEGRRRGVTERMSGAAARLEAERSRHAREAREAGLAEEQLTLSHGVTLARQLEPDILDACRELGVESPSMQVTEVEDLERLAVAAREAARRLRLGQGNLELEALDHRLLVVRRLGRELSEAQAAEGAAAAAVSDQRAALGGPAGAERTRQRLQAAVEEGRRELANLGVEERMLADTLSYLRGAPPHDRCPVCRQPKDSEGLTHELEVRLGVPQRGQHEEASRKVEQGLVQLHALADGERNLVALERQHAGAQQALHSVLAEASQVVGPWDAGADPLAMLQGEEAELRLRLGDLRTAREAREARLARIETGAARLRALRNVLQDDAEFAKTRGELAKGGDLASLDATLEDLAALQEALEAIVGALQAVAAEEARAAVGQASPAIEAHYRALCGHPYFDGLRIEVGEKMVAGAPRSSYAIRAVASADGKTSLASSRLSAAQMNCVALSVFLALSKTLGHQLGFLILDDPSQSLDAPHKVALAGLLERVSQDTPLLVATHDDEFAAMLRARLGPSGAACHILDWAPRAGTTIAGA